MEISVDIPEKELQDVLRLTHAKTKREAIVTAIADFNRRQRMAGLIRHSGTFTAMLSHEEIEGSEVSEVRRHA